MTTTANFGYLERPYLDTIYPYLTEFALASTGMRTKLVIAGQKVVAARAKGVIAATDGIAERTQRQIVNFVVAEGVRTKRIISTVKGTGFRTKRLVLQHPQATAMRTRRMISNHPKAVGSKLLATKLLHLVYGNYLTAGYLTDPYLVNQILAIEGMRTKGILSHPKATGMRTKRVISHPKSTAMRAKRQIKDFLRVVGMRALQTRNFATAMSAFAQLYNTDNLRILSEFASRGASSGSGTNAWGNAVATGQNWSASSTASGDFGVSNLNTDIDEQVWRSADTVTTSVILKCDTEITQGVFVDTLSLRNHNLTTSATVRIEGSNSSTFSSVGVSVIMSITPDNAYWISPDAPMHGYRYWRVVMDDATNPDGHIKIGTILFGRAQIFQGESHTDEVDFSYKDFADSVQTEGFTSVTNSRALRKMLHLEFRVLRFDLGNFKIIRSLSTTYRTTHKLLWIPTPDPVDMNSTSRFAVFGKLSAVPQEKHNWKGPKADYVDVSVDIDESR